MLSFEITCAEHSELGVMRRDEPRKSWFCNDDTCSAWLPDEEVYRLVSAMPAGSPEPVPIVVT